MRHHGLNKSSIVPHFPVVIWLYVLKSISVLKLCLEMIFEVICIEILLRYINEIQHTHEQ